MFDYPVTLTPDDNGTVLVTFADVPEAITFGTDEDEALLNAIDALETGLSFYLDARKPLPVVGKPQKGQKTVRPSALECAKLGVYQSMTEQGIKKAELARRLGWHMPQVLGVAMRNACDLGSTSSCAPPWHTEQSGAPSLPLLRAWPCTPLA